MVNALRLVSFAALAVAARAATCADPKTVSSDTIRVGEKVVMRTTSACAPAAPVAAAVGTPDPNECGVACATACSSIGDLPPTTEDCQTIVDAVEILEGKTAPTFTVAPGNIETLEFGTCRFFYENLSADTLTYCWQDLVNSASAAGAVCFPPVQPVHTLATCTSVDGLFALGASHSNDTSS